MVTASELLDAIPAHVTYCDRDYRVRFANAAFAQFAGSSAEDVQGRHMRELLGPEVFERNEPYARSALAGMPQRFERVVTGADGGRRVLDATFTPHIVDGAVVGFFAFVRDATAETEVQRRLAAAETYRQAFLASRLPKLTFDAAGRVTEANLALSELLLVDAAALTGRPFVDLFEEPDRGEERSRIEALLAGEQEASTLEHKVRRSDGEARWVIASLELASAEPGNPVVGLAQLQDITERREMEDALRRSRALLAEAELIANMGSWELDLATGRSSWSPGIARIFGLEPTQSTDDHATGVAERVFAEDVELLNATLDRAIADRGSFALEYRIVRPDGRLRTISVHGDVVVDDEGFPVRVVGVAHDITDNLRTHDVLHRAATELDLRARELERLARTPAAGDELAVPGSELTARQREILSLVAEGLTNAAIARRLYISEPTVKWHLRETLRKTGAANRTEAVARVFGAGPPA